MPPQCPPPSFRNRLHRQALLALLLLSAGACGTADERHDAHRGHHGGHDHDRARAALERGEVLPLAEILAAVADRTPGDIVEVELEREHGRWVYELKVITPEGRVLELYLDAASAELLKQEYD